jgi:hypothetical protein
LRRLKHKKRQVLRDTGLNIEEGAFHSGSQVTTSYEALPALNYKSQKYISEFVDIAKT